MKNNEQIVSDLRELLILANDGKEGYQSAMEVTDNSELKAIFSAYAGERIVYAAELREHIAIHEGEAENESGGILGGIHRAWLQVKDAFSSKEDAAILSAITTGERAAIARYDELIDNYERHADHLRLLTSQRDGIVEALKQIEILLLKYNA
jgi:uncharacterized protein (TIGR02284 family)